MDGASATRELRALKYTGVIVGITGNAATEDIRDYIQAGADDVLVK
jgi:CheY-like chemotaxis protein